MLRYTAPSMGNTEVLPLGNGCPDSDGVGGMEEERTSLNKGTPWSGTADAHGAPARCGCCPGCAGRFYRTVCTCAAADGKAYAGRKKTVERSFAEANELHGLRFARMLGIRNMYEQRFLTAAVQNMKCIAKAFRLFSAAFSCAKAMLSNENMAFVNG